ncbi:hypothetical protein LUU34_01334100 [Aix galericulata]|nr:hypothetical protein LUU34_01334100 [Aix galericulata]
MQCLGSASLGSSSSFWTPLSLSVRRSPCSSFSKASPWAATSTSTAMEQHLWASIRKVLNIPKTT